MFDIEAKSVAIGFKDEASSSPRIAVADATFKVRAGSFTTLIGRSGCGKSSLLRAIGGLLHCQAGRLSVGGKEVTGPGPDRTMVFQSPRLLPWRSVLENVQFGMELEGRRGRGRSVVNERKERARAAVSMVGLADYENSYPNRLSGGMQQRVNLARALALDPEVLLLDEPFSALDAQTREFLGDELLRIWAVTKKTILFVTHQIDEAVFLSDQIIVLSDGPGSRVVSDTEISLSRPRDESVRESTEYASHIRVLRAQLSGGEINPMD